MPRVTSPTFIPKYRKHGPSGQAVVTIAGHDHYLGPHGSAVSKRLYDRLTGEWIAAGRPKTSAPLGRTPGGSPDLNLTQLVALFWPHVQRHYVKRGKPTSEQACFRLALNTMLDRYGELPAEQFTPLALKAVRETFIARGLSRRVVNAQTSRVRRFFKWAVSECLIPSAVFEALRAVTGLGIGRSEARESAPITSVEEEVVQKTLVELSPTVADMVRVQRLTGMRPGAVCRMTVGAIDRTGKTWRYRDEDHKTLHHGKQTTISIGPQAQRVLLPRLKADPAAPVFSPIEAVRETKDAKRRARATPVTAAQQRRDERRARRAARKGEPLAQFYSVDAYRRAIQRAAKRAYPLPDTLRKPDAELTKTERQRVAEWQRRFWWHPHQLRHAFATEAKRQGFGLDQIGAALNHSSLEVTRLYIDQLTEKAERLAEAVG